MKTYWVPALMHKKDEIIECEVGVDGLLIKCPQKQLLHILEKYKSDQYGWWWNSSKDRYIAEKDDDLVFANPQLAWENGYEIIS